MMNIGFFVRHFTERGTEVAIYDYAKYNEDILHNNSLIICFTEAYQKEIGFPCERCSYEKFKSRFPVVEINNIAEMANVINTYSLHFFYTLTHGTYDIYQFNNKSIWGECRTIKHCVFDTNAPEGDHYISIAEFLNYKYNTNCPVIPHIIDLPECSENLREQLNIPNDAIVLGRHGGNEQFNIDIAKEAIIEFLASESKVYFLFMNTNKFYEHPRIIYLDRNIDLMYKTKFINTCDAMIHAREMGEIFPLSIGEFSMKNKPVITCPVGDLGHIMLLQDKAIQYRSKSELVEIFKNITAIIGSRSDWNAYKLYTPENVMSLFKNIFVT